MFTKINFGAGSSLLSRSGESTGRVVSLSERYCAACGTNHTCAIVCWPDHKITKPCTAGIYLNKKGDWQIA